MIQATASFKDNLQLLPSIDGLERIDLVDANGAIVATIPNEAGKKGSLAVYQYLAQTFDSLDAQACGLGLALFAKNTEDAKNRPGAHPNIDRLLEIADGAWALKIELTQA